MGDGRRFAWAASINPVVGTNKPAGSIPRDRVLDDDELAAIWRACKDDDFGRIVRLLALTGCRREEIGGLRWAEIDLAKGTLSLPKERVKNKRTHVLPLPGLAIEIIESAPRRIGREFLRGACGGFHGLARSKAQSRQAARRQSFGGLASARRTPIDGHRHGQLGSATAHH